MYSYTWYSFTCTLYSYSRTRTRIPALISLSPPLFVLTVISEFVILSSFSRTLELVLCVNAHVFLHTRTSLLVLLYSFSGRRSHILFSLYFYVRALVFGFFCTFSLALLHSWLCFRIPVFVLLLPIYSYAWTCTLPGRSCLVRYCVVVLCLCTGDTSLLLLL